MHTGYHARIGDAAKILINNSKPILSFSPAVVPAPNRPVPLETRVTVPVTGDKLPIILLSHGQGRSNSLSSLEGYAPLAEFWAAHGFMVIQPTHLSSAFLGLTAPKGNELFWKERSTDMINILDNLNILEETVPGLKGRLDPSRIAIAGHSAGSLSASMLMGASNTDSRDGSFWHKHEKRIKAGIILTGLGNGGGDLSENAKALIPFYGIDFTKMTTPALVVCGDEDVSPHLTNRDADWHADPYNVAPGPKDLLTIKGARHGLGGISGWDAAETADESPVRLAVVQRLTWAYLRSQLYENDQSWAEARKAFQGLHAEGTIESKK